MNYKMIYKALVAVRRWLTVLIDAVRARAYPKSKGKRTRKDTTVADEFKAKRLEDAQDTLAEIRAARETP